MIRWRPNTGITIASFFSGIGGLELGLEAAMGAETVFQCERDPYAQRVLEEHWPGVQRHDDITRLAPSEIPPADVWCGGFPCQDISLAGKGAGLAGDKSGLWFAWFDLISVVRPRFLVVENVAAFLGRGLGVVLGQLSEVGYDAEWSVLSAEDVGAPHLRRRVFVIAWQRDWNADCQHEGAIEGVSRWPNDKPGRARSVRDSDHDCEQTLTVDDEAPRVPGVATDAERDVIRREQVQEQGGCRPPVAEHNGEERPLADAEEQPVRPGFRSSEQEGLGGRRPGDGRCAGGAWAAEPSVGRVADGVPHRMDRLRGLGNAVVSQCAHIAGLILLRRIAESGPGGLSG